MAIIKRQGKRGITYKFSVFVGYDQNGKQICKYKSFTPTSSAPKKAEKEAAAAYAEFEKQVRTGMYFDENITFSDFYSEWLETYGKKQLTPAEYENQERTVSRVWLPALGYLPINQIKGIHIQKVINDLEEQGLKPQTIQKYFTELSTVFTRAYKLEIIESNPCRRVTIPRNEKENKIHFFSVQQAESFLKACQDGITVHHAEKIRKNGRKIPAYDESMEIPLQFQVYFTLAIYSGFRRGEMLALQWKDIDFKNHLITISKATSSAKSMNGQFIKDPKSKAGKRTISLPESCFDLLKRWKKEQAAAARALGTAWQGSADPESRYIFIQDDGKQMHLSTPTHKFREILTAYNAAASDQEQLPEIHLHDLRHTSASILISAGVDVATVSRRLGHSKISITLDTYTHALPDIDQAASCALENAFAAVKAKPETDKKTEENQDNMANLAKFWQTNLRNVAKNEEMQENKKYS